MTTFAAVLKSLQQREAGRPLVTYYDEASGERVELSVTTYATWVAKAAALLAEECELERGQALLLDLPPHWLGPVFLGAAWTVGLVVLPPESGQAPDAVVCGPAGLDNWATRAGELPVLACSLRPLGVRFEHDVPPGVRDVGVEIWSQPDVYLPVDPAQPGDLAVPGTSQAALWQTAAAGSLLSDGGRLLTEANPASPLGLASFVEPLARGGSLVLVTHADPARLDAIYVAERATARG